MLTRRHFIRKSAAIAVCLMPRTAPYVMTVNGPIPPRRMNFTLTHEHVLVDFIGADKVSPERYIRDDVFARAQPPLSELKAAGCDTFVECTPAYLGRDVMLLKRLADATGIRIITNTGYYGAAGEKFLPAQVFSESEEQLATRWIKEFENGIDGTDIRPGFIKTGVDKAPLSPAQEKIVGAAAITHLATGLPIAIHTGDGAAAVEELRILAAHGVSPRARIWVHAQNETDTTYHIDAARAGSWVSFDGVNPATIERNLDLLRTMKNAGLLHRVLVPHDSGWYHVGEPDGGEFNNYTCIFTTLIPALRKNGFSAKEIDTLFRRNPSEAFTIGVKKL